MTETLHNKLKMHRAMQGLTQAELATRAGITRRSINAIEMSRMVPSVLLALKIAAVLDTRVEDLFEVSETS